MLRCHIVLKVFCIAASEFCTPSLTKTTTELILTSSDNTWEHHFLWLPSQKMKLCSVIAKLLFESFFPL